MVRVRDSDAPAGSRVVAMRDVQTGQFIQCLGSNDDLRVATSLAWCEVINWYHAEEAPVPMVRVSFTRPDRAKGSLTLSTAHQVLKLTDASVSAGTTAPNVLACECVSRVGRLAAGCFKFSTNFVLHDACEWGFRYHHSQGRPTAQSVHAWLASRLQESGMCESQSKTPQVLWTPKTPKASD